MVVWGDDVAHNMHFLLLRTAYAQVWGVDRAFKVDLHGKGNYGAHLRVRIYGRKKHIAPAS